MSLKHKFLPGAVVEDTTLGERQIRVIVSTPTPDRVKDVLEPGGVDVSAYRANPIVLADHDRAAPIGTAEIEIKSDRVEAVVTFAPAGASSKADEYCALAKAGVLNTVSPGFIEKEATPIKGGGVHITRWELLELSLVTVPCNAEATVIERQLTERNWRVGASLNLPFAPEGASAQAILDADTLDARTAHKGFLAYDAAAAGRPEGYAIPFAKLVEGRLMVDAGTIGAARAALAGAAFSDDVMTKAAAVLDHYDSRVDTDTKAGRVLSKATHARINSACRMIEEGHALLKAMLVEIESPEEDADENEPEEAPPDTGKAAPTLTQRARDLAVLKFRAAP
jgi:HK97 family phage prohead protease